MEGPRYQDNKETLRRREKYGNNMNMNSAMERAKYRRGMWQGMLKDRQDLIELSFESVSSFLEKLQDALWFVL